MVIVGAAATSLNNSFRSASGTFERWTAVFLRKFQCSLHSKWLIDKYGTVFHVSSKCTRSVRWLGQIQILGLSFRKEFGIPYVPSIRFTFDMNENFDIVHRPTIRTMMDWFILFRPKSQISFAHQRRCPDSATSRGFSSHGHEARQKRASDSHCHTERCSGLWDTRRIRLLAKDPENRKWQLSRHGISRFWISGKIILDIHQGCRTLFDIAFRQDSGWLSFAKCIGTDLSPQGRTEHAHQNECVRNVCSNQTNLYFSWPEVLTKGICYLALQRTMLGFSIITITNPSLVRSMPPLSRSLPTLSPSTFIERWDFLWGKNSCRKWMYGRDIYSKTNIPALVLTIWPQWRQERRIAHFTMPEPWWILVAWELVLPCIRSDNLMSSENSF